VVDYTDIEEARLREKKGISITCGPPQRENKYFFFEK
jgi:hypothetical protein